MKEISDKTHVLQTRSTGRYYLNQQQADAISGMLSQEQPQDFIRVDGHLLASNDITGIVSGDQIAALDHTKKGDFKCKYEYWHARGETCAHAEAEAMRKRRLDHD